MPYRICKRFEVENAHMLLTLLATIGMMASFEAFKGADMAGKLLDVVFIIACAIIGLWALRRYLYLLMHAEEVANQAVCPACGTYGRFSVVGEDVTRGEVQVRCHKCSEHWKIAS